MCPLRVLLLWALLCPGRGISWEEIFTRLGSDLLLPIRHNLTLNGAGGQSCDEISWDYRELSRYHRGYIAGYENCILTTVSKYYPNVRISENGSLIIHNVTLENDGIYGVIIYNSTGHVIQRDDYIVHVAGNSWEEIFTRPGSDLLLSSRYNLTLNDAGGQRCDGFSWYYTEFSGSRRSYIAGHKNCILTTVSKYYPNVRISENGSLIIHNVTLENGGVYSMNIHNSTGHVIQRDDYIIHVEGNSPEEIFTRPGSDLLLPIRHNLALIHTYRRRCDGFSWYYRELSGLRIGQIAEHKNCILKESKHFPNVRISENGSLIIHNVTPENGGIYNRIIYKSTGHVIQRDHYIIHVEVPVSDPILNVRCLQNGSAEISCRADSGTNTSIYLTVSDTIYNIPSSERTVRVTVPLVSPPHSWNISCSVMNNISNRSTNQTHATCPGESGSGMSWGHLLSPGAVCVLYTALLTCIVTDLRKMKNEKNRRRYRAEMEPTYYNERN